MDDKIQYEVIQDILMEAGVESREDYLKTFDKKAGKGGGVAGLKQIGRKRKKLIQQAIQSPEAWCSAFPMLCSPEPTGGTEKPTIAPGGHIDWYPSAMLTEGHSLDVPSEGGKTPSYDPD